MVTQQILSLVLSHGARLADPGEFTRRAFLNGRIDLLQAESIIDVIRGKTEASLAVAAKQRSGELSAVLLGIRAHLRQALALLEAYVDFPEEEIDTTDFAFIDEEIVTAAQKIEELISSFTEGRVIREGVSVLIAGKPNTGKSSLLNALLKEKRAIVTSIPGTTRDFIEEVVNIDGLPVKLLDTAGIRDTEDPIEREGVRLSRERIRTADLVLFIIDASKGYDADDMLVAEALSDTKFIIVKNKSDLTPVVTLPESLQANDSVAISTVSGEGLDRLKAMIADLFLHGKVVDSREALFISNVRHRDVLVRVSQILSDFQRALHTTSNELLADDLREALHHLGQVTGETTPDDILDLIFNQFCIGK